MALPTSTTNGATATINGIVYTYNSTKGAWYKQSTASTSVPVTISGTLSVSGNANVGNLGSPTVVNGNSNVTVTANSDVSIAANGAVRMTLAATGNVGVGTASPATTFNLYNATSSVIRVDGDSTTQVTVSRYSTDSSGPQLVLRKQRGTFASSSAATTGDTLGQINFQAFGGTTSRSLSTITSALDAYVSDSDMSSSIRFSTSNVGSAAASEKMRIDASGNVGIANTAPTHTLSVTGTMNTSGNISTTGKYVKTTSASITGGAASGITRYPTFTATSNADIHLSSTITGNATVSQNYGITFAQGSYGTTGAIMFSENNSDGTAIGFYVSNNYGAASQLKVSIEPSGTILPGSNVSQNLGSTTLRWSTVYTGDLELSNGIGDYTIVEGEDDLFLYNNRSGKTYRFMLQEVDPAIVPPKKGT